jgi:hypothetical protein
MPAMLKKSLVAAGVGAIAAAGVLGGATSAYAKSSETLSGPAVARAGHAFRLTVQVADDAGAMPASSRLQVLGPGGGYRWLGTWHKLRLTGGQPPDWEQWSFTVTENHRGVYKFRAVITRYLTTSPVTVVVR